MPINTIDNNKGTIPDIKTASLMAKILNPSSMQLISDIFMVFLSFTLHYFFRFETNLFEISIRPDITLFFSTAIAVTIFWLLIFWFSGLYKNWYIRSPFDEIFIVLRSTFLGSFLLFFFIFMDSAQSPRMLFLIYFVLLSVSVIGGRFIIRRIQKNLRAKRIIAIESVLLGDYSSVIELANKINKSPSWGYTVCGFILLNDAEIINQTDNFILGHIKNLNDILSAKKPAELLIASETSDRNLLMSVVTLCAEMKIVVKIVPDMYDFFTGQTRTLPIYGIPLIEINTQLLKPWEKFIKRFIDIVFSLLVIVIGMPIWLMIAVVQKLESRGPIFYKQERVGKNEKRFMIYKFRSMVQDAEKHGPQWAVVNDPRVTKFGKFLRSSHLDEIPQFWNVLKGEMSLVGPRPERPVFVNKFSDVVPYYKRRLVVRPGITGWWQVNYTTYMESIEEIENRLKDDFYYIENMSLKLDLEIIVRTVFIMLKGHGQT